MNPSDPIIQLVVARCVGETERLNVHRGVLCKSSKFFQNAMKPEWTDTQAGPNTIDLPDDPVDVVSDYIKWLYYDTIPDKQYEAVANTREERAEEAEKVFVVLAEAYVFGEKIVDTKYKNVVLQTMFTAQKAFRWSMGPESVKIVYKGTPPKSPLRRWIAENVAYVAHDDSKEGVGWMQFIKEYPEDAKADMLEIIVKVRPSRPDSSPGVGSYLEEE
ncbi:unnamed protein product [Alternaria alternata]|nr:hypothetical protein AA0118_g10752 [Alternaria tenuissima]RYO54714.1 hypothetical protein AA0116_g9386 [Alternaria tenuissima]